MVVYKNISGRFLFSIELTFYTIPLVEYDLKMSAWPRLHFNYQVTYYFIYKCKMTFTFLLLNIYYEQVLRNKYPRVKSSYFFNIHIKSYFVL